jgi:hypothetical protein
MSEDSVEDNINEYYKLKSKYDEQNQKQKQKILNNKRLSIKEKKHEFKQLKPKCVNCGKPGGTTFASVFNKETSHEPFRELRAFCKAVEPCGLNINIAVGHFLNMSDMLADIEDEISVSKKEIISDKNKLLFGLITTEKALDNFDAYKENINVFTSALETYLQEYMKLTDNPETKDMLKERLEKSYFQIQEIKHSMADFNTTDDVQFVRDAVNIYNTNLTPTLSEILQLKYRENTIMYDEQYNTYHLIQNKYSIQDTQINLGKFETVVYNTALQNAPDKTKRPLIVEPSSSYGSEETIESGFVDSRGQVHVTTSIVGVPTFNKDGTVTWSNKNYQSVWNAAEKQLQNALLSDIDWLQEFMNNCVKLRLEGKPCQFINPSNLIIPPQILEDGNYDFGNSFYNNYFTKLGKDYQKVLFSLAKEKDGTTNYEPFTNQLQTLLAKELKFGTGYFNIMPENAKPLIRR